jgi:hypothetical protein
MPDHSHIFRVHSHAAEIAEQNAFMRDLVRRAMEILGSPAPDTFPGRKTQETFPAEDPLERPDIQNLIHSELQPPKE